MPRPKGIRHNGHAIRAWRVERGLTDTQLAELVGYSRSALTNIECERKSTIPLFRLTRIARVLTVNPAALVRESADVLDKVA